MKLEDPTYLDRAKELTASLNAMRTFQPLPRSGFRSDKQIGSPDFESMTPPPPPPYVAKRYPIQPAVSNVPWYLWGRPDPSK